MSPTNPTIPASATAAPVAALAAKNTSGARAPDVDAERGGLLVAEREEVQLGGEERRARRRSSATSGRPDRDRPGRLVADRAERASRGAGSPAPAGRAS